MKLLRVGLGILNPTVAGIRQNTDLALALAVKAARGKVAVLAFPEMCLFGYTPGDRVQTPGLLEIQVEELQRFARETGKLEYPTVFVVGLAIPHQGNLYNVAAVVCGGKILAYIPKEALPGYDIFYDPRFFSRGFPGMSFRVGGVPLGDFTIGLPFGIMSTAVCEDDWDPLGPLGRRAFSGAVLHANISAPPFRFGINNTRLEMTRTRSSDFLVAYLYAGLLGANDGLVFDGPGFVHHCGRTALMTPRWREGLYTTVLDLEMVDVLRWRNRTWADAYLNFQRAGEIVPVIACPWGPKPDNTLSYPVPKRKSIYLGSGTRQILPMVEILTDLREALVLGFVDYYVKTGAFSRIIHLLSGGADSLFSLHIMVEGMRRIFSRLSDEERDRKIRETIICLSLPTVHNSTATKNIARVACEELGVTFLEIPIGEEVERETAAVISALDRIGVPITDVTRQNIIARVRAARAWNISNSLCALVPNNSKLEESGAGYCTFLADHAGGLSLTGDVPKVLIDELLRRIDRTEGRKRGWKHIGICLATKPSAELAANQTDEDDLGPYPVLGNILYYFMYERKMPSEIYWILRQTWTDKELTRMYPKYRRGDLKKWVRHYLLAYATSEAKRSQMPISIHVGNVDLDYKRAWHEPIVQGPWIKEDLRRLDEMPD